MKNIVYLFILFLFLGVSSVAAQTSNFEDGFEDGDFSSNPVWSGDTTDFGIITKDTNHLLHSKENPDGVSYLSTRSSIVNGSWEFYINLDFSPSSNNFAEVFLMSDISNLTNAVDGYALKADGNDDVFKIVRYDNGSPAVIVLSGTTDISGGGKFRVRVTRDASGNWTLEVGEGYDGFLQQEAIGTDTTYKSAQYFGVKATYTSSRSDNFYFDFRIDLPPFAITDASVNDNQITVTFNRGYDQTTVQASDFMVDDGIGSPASISFPTSTTVLLDFSQALSSGKYSLSVSGIQDLNGKNIEPNTTSSFIIYDTFVSGDVVINEFMYDPPTGQTEYLEIRNLSSKYLNLQNWQLADESGIDPISTEPLTLKPLSFLVITGNTATLKSIYGQRLYFQMANFPSFNNSGDAISITSSNNILVDSLNYMPDWGGNGVSLERRSPTAPSVQANFADSPNLLDGTPGFTNEVDEDTTPPSLNDLIINNDQILILVFSEGLQTNAAENESNYLLNNGISISNVIQIAPNSVKLTLGSELQNNTSYQLSITNQQDIFGNAAPINTSFIYYVISAVDSDDVYINEFMYDPPDGETEYIELFNPTNKSLNLQGWTINDNSSQPIVITKSQLILPPDSYVVLAPDNTILSENPGMLLLTMGSNFPSFNNGGDDIVISDSAGTPLDSLRYNSAWGGADIALERRTVDVAPIQANFGEAQNGFGTPGSKNEILPDTSPPTLNTFIIENSKRIKLIFSEQLDEVSATNKNNYTLSNGLSIAAATLSADTVELTFSDALQNNTSYILKASNITDLFGNTTAVDTTFIYLEPSPVDAADIYINEFMYDPPSGQTEYIELYNPTNNSLDLKGWTLNDNSGDPSVIVDTQFIIPPESYVVVAPDETLLEQYPNLILIQMGSNFPSFNNSGDDIVIKSADGLRLDSLQYTDDWGGNNIALERRSINAPSLQPNFGEAPNGFGSPGSVNLVEKDNLPPKLINAKVVDSTKINLLFSEPISTTTANASINYSLNPDVNINLIASIANKIILFLKQPLKPETLYRLTIKNLEDIFGNKIEIVNKKLVYIPVGEAQHKNIVINEFLVNGEPEFVELYNRSDKNIDLSGWSIGDKNNTTIIGQINRANSTFTIPKKAMDRAIPIKQNLILQPGDYLIVTASSSLATRLDNGIYLSDLPSFNDDEDIIYIQDANGTVIDSLHYTPAFGNAIEGTSLERKDPDAASNDPFNWGMSTSIQNYTAGVKNSIYKPDTNPPEIVFAELLVNGNVAVSFNEFIQITSDLTFKINGKQTEVIEFNASEANYIILQSGGITAGQPISVEALEVTDVSGNKTSITKLPVAQRLKKGDVVLNELMFDPIDASDDDLPDQSEYIELYNTREYAISLEGIALRNAADEDGDIDRLTPVSTHLKWIPAHGTAIIYAGEKPKFKRTNMAKFFDMKGAPVRSLIRVDASSLSLASSDDAIFLSTSSGATIDSVFYNETWHNPNIIDTDGIALERLSPDGPSNAPSNWGSSTAPKGGTPNAENTLFQNLVEVDQKEGLFFSSGGRKNDKVFSPDGDGYDDVLNIHYRLKEPDYLITVKIYDRYGRLIIELTDSKPAGTHGTIVWKGLKENGNQNRIGIYIVIFRAFDSTNGSNVALKKTVVLARRLN